MNRAIIRHGFILILLALISSLFIPAMQIPRLGLSAHTIGLLGGTLLIAIGAVWQQFSLTAGQARLMVLAWLYANYVNWLGCLAGAVLGAGRTTPLAASGVEGAAWAETLVLVLLGSVALASLVGAVLSLWGLRGPAAD
jgi:hydroxylaminobenzene mutase